MTDGLHIAAFEDGRCDVSNELVILRAEREIVLHDNLNAWMLLRQLRTFGILIISD